MERASLVQVADNDSGVRRRLSLDGVWQFRHEDGPWREAHVPGPWQAQFSDLVDTSGRAVYKRSFALPEGWGTQELALQFGAVSYFCEVLLNGQAIGSHEGAFLPFEIVLPASALKSSNELEVRVTMPSADQRAYPDYPFGEVPHGKISWYGRIGGLWQSVALEARDPAHVESIVITAGTDGVAHVELGTSAAANGKPVQLSVLDAGGNVVAEAGVTAGASATASLRVANARLWSTDEPSLYSLVVDLGTDKRVETFGFRTIEARGGQILLNGKPIYIRGALDQDYYPDGIYTPPSLEFLEDQARKAKHLGLNLLRCHIKVPDRAITMLPTAWASWSGPKCLMSPISPALRLGACARRWKAFSSVTATIPRSSPGR